LAAPGATTSSPRPSATIAALLTLGEQVIQIDRDYETLRTDMQALLEHLGVTSDSRRIDNILSIDVL
jgi:hypothetical protein